MVVLVIWTAVWAGAPLSGLVVPLPVLDLVEHPSAGVHVYRLDGGPWRGPMVLEVSLTGASDGPWTALRDFVPSSTRGGIWMTQRRGYTAWSVVLPRSGFVQGKHLLIWFRVQGYPESSIPVLVRW